MEPKNRIDNFIAKAAASEYADENMVPITDREYWLNEMAEHINSISELPAIEEGDDGKVLTATNGQATWESASGGSSDIVIVTNNDGLSASWNELDDYFNAHKIVILPYYFEEDGEIVSLYYFLTALNLDPDTGNYYAHFSTAKIFENEPTLFVLAFMAADPDGTMYED